MAWFTPLIGLGASMLGSLFGGGGSSSSSSSSSTPLTELNYTAPVNAASTSFDWQNYAGQWEAIGIALLVIVLLGSFEATRELAIVIAVLLAGVILLGKVG